MHRVSVVVLNWNGASATIKTCQSALRAFRACPNAVKSADLWVVDNGSAADDRNSVQRWCATQDPSSVSFIANRENQGFAKGMNAGIAAASGTYADFYLLLNNDIELDSEAVDKLLRHSQARKHMAITGLSLLDPKTGLLQTAGGYRYYPSLGVSRPLMAGQALRCASKGRDIKPDYVSGAAMWLNGNFLRRAGGLPEKHFLYFEELELNQLLNSKESIGWCFEAVAIHQGGGSLKTRKLQEFGAYHAALSAFRYTKQYHTRLLPTVVLARIGGLTLRALKRGQPGLLWAVFRALYTFMKGNPPT